MRELKYLIILLEGTYYVPLLFNGLIEHTWALPKQGKLISAGYCILSFGPIMQIKATVLDKVAKSYPNTPPRGDIDATIIEHTLNRDLYK